MFINVCLHGMLEEYRIFMEKLSFASFSKLMEAAHRTNEPVCRTLRFRSTSYPSSDSLSEKRPIFVAFENGKGLDHPAQRNQLIIEVSPGSILPCHISWWFDEDHNPFRTMDIRSNYHLARTKSSSAHLKDSEKGEISSEDRTPFRAVHCL